MIITICFFLLVLYQTNISKILLIVILCSQFTSRSSSLVSQFFPIKVKKFFVIQIMTPPPKNNNTNSFNPKSAKSFIVAHPKTNSKKKEEKEIFTYHQTFLQTN